MNDVPMCPHMDSNTQGPNLSRRTFLLGASTVGASAALAACQSQSIPVGVENQQPQESSEPALTTALVAFDGPHQAGIATPGQAHLNVVAFNLHAGNDRESVRRLLKLWTEDARRLTNGQNPLGSLEPEMTMKPANLTITCGFGPRLFDIIDRRDQRPSWLAPLPVFSEDKLEPQWAESDLVLQICADDPVTLAFASRHMQRAAVDFATVVWMQQGFLNAYGAKKVHETPRNLFGQIDGTINPVTDDDYDSYVWIQPDNDAPAWVHGGSCMVVRRINMNLDTWEMLDRTSREVAMGRYLSNGAPLTGQAEHDPADFHARDEYGLPVIDPRSHMALAAPPRHLPLQRIRRRAYNYDLPPIPGSGQSSNSGLVFVCFQQNPLDQFVPIQQRLNDADRLNEWITHIGSAVFVIPPGTDPTGENRDLYWGQALLET